MRLRYRGDAGARHVGDYHWTRDNGYVADVREPELVVALLVEGDFCLDASDPLVEIVGPAAAGELALAGVTSLADLAEATRARARELSERLRVSRAQIGEWAVAAHAAQAAASPGTSVEVAVDKVHPARARARPHSET